MPLTPPPPLPSAWVDRIFAKLTVAYGAEFLRRWEGLDMAVVKAEWGVELGGVSGEAIAHALQHLPQDRSPTVMAFRALARSAPLPSAAALPAPASNPEVMREALRGVRTAPDIDARRWARGLRAREAAGDRLTRYQRAAWREALPVSSTETGD